METGFQLWASPWWVNVLIFVPIVAFIIWGRKLHLSTFSLFVSAIYAIAMGYLEAAAVVYLRSVGAYTAYGSSAFENIGERISSLPARIADPALALTELPQLISRIEVFREAATIIMLVAVAILVAKTPKDRWAMFLWMFAIWDIVYYLGLWLTVRWPSSLATPDVLFLIPQPWYAEVWFPLLVSTLTLLAVLFSRGRS